MAKIAIIQQAPVLLDRDSTIQKAVAALEEGERDNPLAHRVQAETARLTASGLDSADAARQAPGAPVVCELFADEALRQPVRQWRLTTDARRGHSVHVLADGLQPGRHYWYRFASGNAVSLT